jgi:ribosomal protein S18 acetylase RimI-like enzyme
LGDGGWSKENRRHLEGGPAGPNLSPRLAIGVAAWRNPDRVLTAVRRWIEDALAASNDDGRAVFVAKKGRRVVGVVTAEQREHWSGDADAYVGELITASDVEGRGVGRALLEAVEVWARDRRLGCVTLETGAANERARGFYQHLGYRQEDVRLTKLL